MSFSAEQNRRSLFSGAAKRLYCDDLGECSEGMFLFNHQTQLSTADKILHKRHLKHRSFYFRMIQRRRAFYCTTADFNALLLLDCKRTAHPPEDLNGPASSATSFWLAVLYCRGWIAIAPCWPVSQLVHASYEDALHHSGKQSGFGLIHPSWSCSCFWTGCTDNILFGRYVSLKQVTDGAQQLPKSVS